MQGLVNGKGETPARGWDNLRRIMAQMPCLQDMHYGADQSRTMQATALADDSAAVLRDLLTPVT